MALGEAVLGSLYLLPPATRLLLERYPLHFLYGSVAADISFAKKYAPVGRHCHHWHVGEEILETAPTPALRAVGYGYLSHLAADTLAHNTFVPRQLLLTPGTSGAGHTYWEHRMDVHVGEGYLGKSRRLVMDHDHQEADAHFDSVLSRTLFSFQTNRMIFRGMMVAQDNDRWKQLFERVLKNSPHDVPDTLRRQLMARAYDDIMDFLIRGRASRPARLDPIGEVNLRLAKRVRSRAGTLSASSDPQALEELAQDFFPLPSGPHFYLPQVSQGPVRAILGLDGVTETEVEST